MKLTPQEIDSGELTQEHLSLAVQAVKMNGFIVFERVLPFAFVAELRTNFMSTLEAHMKAHPANRGKNRVQMHLPFRAPFNDPRILCNPLALSVVDALLGADPVCHYFASDTALPGSEYQDVHSDIALLFPETVLALPAYSLVANIPLVDFRADNGPLEAWPGGTHYMPGGVDMKKLASTMHSEAVLMPAGSLLVRDMRMWHRGTPNQSQEARPNLALIYSRPWLKHGYPPIDIPRAEYEALSPRAQKLFRMEKIH